MSDATIYDIERLACEITGLDYDSLDGDFLIIEDALNDQYNIGIEDFTTLIERLMGLVAVEVSTSGIEYKGFTDANKERLIVKVESYDYKSSYCLN